MPTKTVALTNNYNMMSMSMCNVHELNESPIERDQWE